MGRFYCGPYAGLIGAEHEGFAARLRPGGELAGTWTAATEEFVAHVAACACGWTGVERHAPTDEGEDTAVESWEREHLQPLVTAAAREGWRRWTIRAGSAVSEVAAYVGADRVDLAVPAMRRLVEDVQTWAGILAEVRDEMVVRGGGGR